MRRTLPKSLQFGIAVAAVGALGVVMLAPGLIGKLVGSNQDVARAEQPMEKARPGEFIPTAEQWAGLTVKPVQLNSFQAQRATDGKIAINDEHTTPVFSPYAGRVQRLLVNLGDSVKPGQPLFTIEAADMVQAQNDLLTALASSAKSRSQLSLARVNESRQRDLFVAKAVAQRDVEQARADAAAAASDARSADVAVAAARNRLRLLGKSDQEIAAFESKGTVSSETAITAPIAGTVIQRKVGPGQYVAAGSSDPVYSIGDLSSVWLVANVRESDVPTLRVGQPVEVRVLAYPDRTFKATLAYIASSVDPATRRLQVRAVVDNKDGALKPEMFATFSIVTGAEQASAAVPAGAVIYEGDSARVWVVTADRHVVSRPIRTGMTDKGLVQVTDGLAPGEQVIVKGGLFVDRAGSGEAS